MQTTISSKHLDVTPAITLYAERKTAKLRRFFDRIQQIDVVIDKARNGFKVEIITDVEHHTPFVATATDADMYACIDLGVDRASRQLKDHKSRVRNHKHVASPTRAISGTGRRKSGTKASRTSRAVGPAKSARGGSRGRTTA